MAVPDVESVCQHVREAVRAFGLKGDSTFDVATIQADTDLEALGIDSMIVGNLCAQPSRRWRIPQTLLAQTRAARGSREAFSRRPCAGLATRCSWRPRRAEWPSRRPLPRARPGRALAEREQHPVGVRVADDGEAAGVHAVALVERP